VPQHDFEAHVMDGAFGHMDLAQSARLICIDPIADPRWRALLAKKETATLFHSPEWLSVLAQTYGFHFTAYVLLDQEGSPIAGVPVCDIDDIVGHRRVSLPFSDFCDPLVDSFEQWRLLVDALSPDVLPLGLRCLRFDVAWASEEIRVTKRAKWHGIRLQENLPAIWAKLSGKARTGIRKAQKHGVEVRPAERKDLAEFFHLHVRVRKYKYGLLAQPFSFFENVWDSFVEPGNGCVLVARLDGRIISGVLYLVWNNTLTYKINASDPDYLYCSPNDLIVWEGLRYADEKGLQLFDFGLSDIGQ
jgi:CelD/BcsL family acetyltransferase involved in cellulose biosynthesis